MSTLLYHLGIGSARHPWRVLVAWVLVLAGLGGLAASFGTPPTNLVKIPDARFAAVMDHLEERVPGVTGTVSTAVVTTEDGSEITPAQERAIRQVMGRWEDAPHVTRVVDPFAAQQRLTEGERKLAQGEARYDEGRRQLWAGAATRQRGVEALADLRRELARQERTAPDAPRTAQLREQVAGLQRDLAAGEKKLDRGHDRLDRAGRLLDDGRASVDAMEGTRFVSEDGSAALVQIGFDLDPQSIDPADREVLVHDAERLHDAGLRADFGSEIVQEMSVVGPGEIVGLATAALVLLAMLGSLVAAGLPLLLSLIGVGTGLAAAVATSHFFDLHSMTPALALMLGLAVGIDYVLFILNRHREQYLRGMERHESIGRATGTAGSAVVFAGATVIVALVALVLSGMPILAQMGLVAAGTVAVAVLVAITLGPALLGLLGHRVAGRRAWRRRGASRRAFGDRWVRLVTARPWVTVLAVVLGVLVLALPATQLRLGLPDGSSEDPGSSANRAYTTVAEKFGPGMNGPLVVVADLPQGTGERRADQVSARIAAQLADQSGVQSVMPIGRSDDQRTLAWQVVLDSGPTEARTSETVHFLQELAPNLGEQYDAEVGLTGRTIANIEISERMAQALPPYLAVVVGLSLLILVVVFRSLVVPLIATGGFLLSVAAAFGALVAVFQWGWLGSLFGVHTPGPLMSFGPILLIGVLFGLAMDYQMFLVSGMREAHAHGEDAVPAVRTGFVHGAKVVTAAAAIMFAVFGGFVFSHMVMVRPIGFGLAVGVLVDAFLVRMTLTPAVMTLLGEKAWWMPRWLDRLLPDLDVEGAELSAKLAAERADGEAAAQPLEPAPA